MLGSPRSHDMMLMRVLVKSPDPLGEISTTTEVDS